MDENQQGESDDFGCVLEESELKALKNGMKPHCKNQHNCLNNRYVLVDLQMMVMMMVVVIMVTALFVRMRMRMNFF